MTRSAVSTCAWIIAILLAAHAHAAQHLVRPGDSWAELAPRLRPGDEVILMPGKHQPASLDSLKGTRERPITIRGLTTRQPSVIEARQYGIRLRRPEHVVVRDLAITGATIAGVFITSDLTIQETPRPVLPDDVRRAPTGPPWPANVTVRNVTIEQTGPQGRRNGIHLEGVRHILVERVRIDGWGGAAVKVIGSAEVRIEYSIMRGREDHGQLSGVHIRGGSEQVRVMRCFIADAGEAAIVLGETPASALGASEEKPYEARRISIERNVIRRGEAAFAFLSADNCIIRNNTILDPARFAYFIAPPGHLRQVVFGSNITVWRPGTLAALAHIEPPASGSGLVVEQNLWWTNGTQAAIAKLGKPAGDVRAPQVTDIDPDLDEQFKPRHRRAQLFGTEGP